MRTIDGTFIFQTWREGKSGKCKQNKKKEEFGEGAAIVFHFCKDLVNAKL